MTGRFVQGLRFVELPAGFKLIFVLKIQSVSTLNVAPVVFCKKAVHPERPQNPQGIDFDTYNMLVC